VEVRGDTIAPKGHPQARRHFDHVLYFEVFVLWLYKSVLA